MIREAIIRKIVERDVAGESLREEDVRRDDELLHAAAIDDFAAWEPPLVATRTWENLWHRVVDFRFVEVAARSIKGTEPIVAQLLVSVR